MTAVYALYRRFYGDQEAAFLASDADTFTYQDLLAHRRKLHIGYTDMMAQVGYLLRLGPHATDTTLTAALGFVERLPQVFGLIAEGKVAVLAARLLLARSAVLTGPQARVFDAALAERLVKPGEVLSIPALREYADTVVIRLDPAAAEARRQRAKDERTLADPGNTEPGYLVGHGPITAEHVRELAGGQDVVIRPFGERTPSQRPGQAGQDQAPEAPCPTPVPAPAVAATTPPTETPAVSATSVPPAPPPASLVQARGTRRYRPTANLITCLSLLYPRCVFPLCTRPATRAQIDHSREFDHRDPTADGRRDATNLTMLCRHSCPTSSKPQVNDPTMRGVLFGTC